MTYNIYNTCRDKQEDPVVTYCDRCSGEIYYYDECYIIDHETSCFYCVTTEEAEWYAPMSGYDYLEEIRDTYGC